MSDVRRWSGREARALREASRMTVRAFAAHLGVSDRTVSKWEAGGEQMIPLPDSQALLDTALQQAGEAAQERFQAALSDLSVPTAIPQPAGLALLPYTEPDLIPRPDDIEALVAIISEASSTTGTPVVALCGPGGFGKTTPATQMCHDRQVAELFSEILWVETGEDCTPTRVVELVSDLCFHLDGTRPALTDPEQAGFHLARVIGVRPILLVIDNVWAASDLAPFLLGGPSCIRLVTTRNLRVCPATTRVMRLGPMSPSDIGELLRRNVPQLAQREATQLAKLCGGWPLLATVVASSVGQDVVAGASPAQAASEATEVLRSHGPQAFDVWDADQRTTAIGHAIISSVNSLDDHVEIPGTSMLGQRYLSLAIFPATAPVPLRVLSHWWAAAYGWKSTAVRHFCRALADRSLISAYLADHGVILLHDVFRAYLRQLIGGDWPALHNSLIEAYRPTGGQWEALPDEYDYMWRHLTYHLSEAGLTDELLDVLCSPSLVMKRVVRLGHHFLVGDGVALEAIRPVKEIEHPRHHDWLEARALTDAGYLLHNIKYRADIATTLVVSLLRSTIEHSGIDPLRRTAAQAPEGGFHAAWVRPNQAGSDETAHGHVGAVVSVAARGNLVASCGEDGVVRLWDLAERRHIRSYRGHVGWVFAAAISPDLEAIASAGEDGVIRLWRIMTGEAIGALIGHTRRVRSLAFARAGGLLISGSEDGRVNVWNIEEGSLLRGMNTPGCPVWSVTVDSADMSVAAAGEDEFVRLFDLRTGQLLEEKAAHRDWVRSVSFAPAAPLLASGSGDRTVVLWNTAGRCLFPVRRINISESRVRSVAISEKADLVVTSTEKATIHAFTADGCAGRVQSPPGVDWVRSVALAEDGTIVAGCEDGAVRLWRAGDHGELTLLCGGQNTIWSTQFVASGQLAALGYGNGVIELCDVGAGQTRRRLDAAKGRVWSLAGNRDHIAAACGDGLVRVWSLRDHGEPQILNDDQERTWAVSVATDSQLLAASTGDGRVRLWDLVSGEMRWECDARAGRVRSLAFDDGGAVLAACGGDGKVRLWHSLTGDLVAEFTNPTGWARTVTVDPAGKRLAVGSGTGDIYLGDVAADQFTGHLTGHTGRILMLGFTSDPDRLVSAAADGTARIWSLIEQRQLAEVRIDGSLHCAAFDPSTGHLVAGSAGGVTMMMVKPATSGGDGGKADG